eukprot:c14235_g1_i2 orf=175-723(+)
MDDDAAAVTQHRTSTRTRRVASKMEVALTDTNSRAQAALARLDALESDNVGIEAIEVDDDDEASLDEEDQVFSQKKQPKGSKRKTRQAKALEKLESARKLPRSFLEVLQELHLFQANLEALPYHVPTYLRAVVGPPNLAARRHFCSVCGYFANYTCTLCGARFCSCHCRKVHSDTRCQKFVA